MPKRMPRLILVRHGLTEWAQNGRHTGRTDLALVPEGVAETRAFARELIKSQGNAVICLESLGKILRSPRQRCMQTSDAFFGTDEARKAEGLDPIEVLDDLREWDYGAYEGLRLTQTSEIQQERPGWSVFRDGAPDHPTDPAQPGESVQQAGERADRVLAYVSKVHQETHKDVVAVTHGHFSRVLIARFLKLPVSVGASFQMSTTGAAVLSYDHSCWEEPTLLGMFAPSLRPTAFLPSALDPKHEEYQYLDLVDEVIRCGEYRADRTGTGTRAIFAPQLSLEFDLTRGTLPLLTTKRVFVRGVIEELLWFISGKTDAKLLADRGVHIWDGNGSRDFLAQRGLGHRREGDLGPVYGFQWRHFGAQYVDADTDYTGQGVDQLANVIHAIKTNPTDRRILLTAWNPVDLSIMALPPCHILCQFFVSMREGQRPCLECQMYQRSCDLGLGVPFNIASYALLTHLIAAVTGCEASKFSLVLGDAHVYMDHIEPLKEQLKRAPRDFPKVHLKREVSNIDDIRPEDIDIQGYQPHGKIEMRMSV